MSAHRQPLFLRRAVIFGVLALVATLMVARAVHLHVLNQDFLRGQGEARNTRVVEVSAHRGMILDRRGEALAASTPVDTVWANPRKFNATPAQFRELAKHLDLPVEAINRQVYERPESEFAYLKRQINPDDAQKVMALKIPGVALQREYRRYYPSSEVTAHALGFTDIDDKGQEGLERTFDSTLRGVPGKRRIVRDPGGRVVEDVESILEPEPGRDIVLSIDRQLQYLAWRELSAAVKQHNARAGSVVLLDVHSGEVLAMVNLPSFNPNNRDELSGDKCRNRAATHMFEPGSTIKPFTVAAALDSGRFRPGTLIDTTPGQQRVGNVLVRDIHNYGLINVATALQKSSNIAVGKMALELPAERLWNAYTHAGLGTRTTDEFPAEALGVLNHHSQWRDAERVTAAYGYGMSVTALQLARAYAALANDGVMRKVTFRRQDRAPNDVDVVDRVMRPELAAQLRRMLETATSDGGTGTLARVPGYRIAGKTGTVKIAENGGYSENRYRSLFAGFAPVREPRLAMVVVVDEPRDKKYYGGEVAAPVFANVMAGALRTLNVPPDDMPTPGTRMALANAHGGAR